MQKTHETHKEPFLRLVKRDSLPWYRAWLIRFLSILAALVVAALVSMLLTHKNPIML